MTLSLTVLGCAGSYAGPGEACSGYLVRSCQVSVAVDLGPGTLANLQRHVRLWDVDAVVLSHEHPDHWLELPVLRNALRYYLGGEDLPVYGTAGNLEMAGTVIGELRPTLDWTVVNATSQVTVGDLRFSFARTDHPVEALAMRIDQDPAEGGRSLAYSADTGPDQMVTGDLAALIDEVDLFLCEATIPSSLDGEGAPHLSGRHAGRLAGQGRVRRLLLTHLAPGVDGELQRSDARSAFSGPVELARTHATYSL